MNGEKKNPEARIDAFEALVKANCESRKDSVVVRSSERLACSSDCKRPLLERLAMLGEYNRQHKI